MTTIVLYPTTDQGLVKAAIELMQAMIPFKYTTACIQLAYWPHINDFLLIRERMSDVTVSVEEL